RLAGAVRNTFRGTNMASRLGVLRLRWATASLRSGCQRTSDTHHHELQTSKISIFSGILLVVLVLSARVFRKTNPLRRVHIPPHERGIQEESQSEHEGNRPERRRDKGVRLNPCDHGKRRNVANGARYQQ